MTLPTWLPLAIGALFVLGIWQAWRQHSGTTPEARLRALEEELEAVKQEQVELERRLRQVERQGGPVA